MGTGIVVSCYVFLIRRKNVEYQFKLVHVLKREVKGIVVEIVDFRKIIEYNVNRNNFVSEKIFEFCFI